MKLIKPFFDNMLFQNYTHIARGLGFSVILLCFVVITGCDPSGQAQDQEPSAYLEAVQTFADNVLEHGRDRYGEVHSPLFADGIDVETKEPMRWRSEGNTWVISNFGTQQNLLRILVGLSEITGDTRYRMAAEEATRYMFQHYTDSQGLLYWGGHQFVDLETLENRPKERPHELKTNFPFYKFLWEVDPDATRQLLRAIWNAHVREWEVLVFNRHGAYNKEMERLWDYEFRQLEPFFERIGLTFINAGTDMIHAAMALYFLEEEEGAREWGLRLYEQYVRARHPETGLGVYQYSQPLQREEPPKEGPLEGLQTWGTYGDRAKNQFGQVYGEIAMEGNVLFGSRVNTIYGRSAVMLLHLSEQLGDTPTGKKMLKWTLDGLRAVSKHAYVPEEDHFRPMWTDGTDLTGDVYPRTGYYGKKGTEFKPYTTKGAMLISFAKGARLSDGDPQIWNAIRHMIIGRDLGDPGSSPDEVPSLNLQTDESSGDVLVAVLELHRMTGQQEYLTLAERIGDNILKKRFHNGYFQRSKDHIYSRFDDPEPLALLMLEAVRQGTPDRVPPYLTGRGMTDGSYEGLGRVTDHRFYNETR